MEKIDIFIIAISSITGVIGIILSVKTLVDTKKKNYISNDTRERIPDITAIKINFRNLPRIAATIVLVLFPGLSGVLRSITIDDKPKVKSKNIVKDTSKDMPITTSEDMPITTSGRLERDKKNIVNVAEEISKFETYNYDIMIKLYKKIIKLNPSDVVAYYDIGNLYQKKSNYDEAIKSYKKAIKLNPNHVEAYYNMGNAYQRKGNYDEAIRCYEKAIELNPHFAETYHNMGLAYQYLDESDKAIDCFRKASMIRHNERFTEISKRGSPSIASGRSSIRNVGNFK